MSQPQRHLVLSLGFVLLALSAVPPAQARRVRRSPILAQIDCHIGAKPEVGTVLATWNVRVKKQVVTMYVTRLQVLNGNVAYYNIISAFEPYRVPFTIMGEAATLDRIVEAHKDQQLRMQGSFQLSTIPGTYFISTLDVQQPPTPTAGQ